MLFVVLSQLALADIPPPERYVEQCTTANHQTSGQVCTTCEGTFSGREECEALETQGYEKRCKTRGASVWSEVMCKAEAAEPAKPAPEPEKTEPEKTEPEKPEPDAANPASPSPNPAKTPEPEPAESTSTATESRCSTVVVSYSWWLPLVALGWARRRS